MKVCYVLAHFYPHVGGGEKAMMDYILSMKKYNIEVDNIGLNYDGKILNMDTKRCRINGADYGYIGELPRVLKCMPLRVDVKRCPKAQVGSKHWN